MSSHADHCDYKYELLSSYCGPHRDDLLLLQSFRLYNFYGVFLGHLDLDFGLLDKLLANRIISGAELNAIKSINFVYEKHRSLMRWISENDKTTEFDDALEETHQTHLINYGKSFGCRYIFTILKF